MRLILLIILIACVLWFLSTFKKQLSPTKALGSIRDKNLELKPVPVRLLAPAQPTAEFVHGKGTRVRYWGNQDKDSSRQMEEIEIRLPGYYPLKIMYFQGTVANWTSGKVQTSADSDLEEAAAANDIYSETKSGVGS